MKILFLTPWYPDEQNPNHGIFVRDQAVAVRKHHEVQLVTAKVDYTSFALLSFSVTTYNFKDVTEHHILIKKSLPVFNQLVFFIITIWQTMRIVRHFVPDVIHGNIGYPGAFWSWMVSRLVAKPYIITEHTSRFVNNFRSGAHKLFTIQFLKRASAIISVSNHSADEIFSFIGKRPIVIPNIIDFEKFNNVALNDNPVCQIGFLGSLNTDTKGLDVLLKAIAGIHDEFVLHIGGAGKRLNEYKSLAHRLGIGQKCVFHGFVSHNQVPPFMKQLHFFVSASRFESFGMVMVEAMACGLPVVATNSGGPSDFITPHNGILIEKENVKALQMAIEKMMASYTKFNAPAIREFALRDFSYERFIREIDTVYASLG